MAGRNRFIDVLVLIILVSGLFSYGSLSRTATRHPEQPTKSPKAESRASPVLEMSITGIARETPYWTFTIYPDGVSDEGLDLPNCGPALYQIRGPTVEARHLEALLQSLESLGLYQAPEKLAARISSPLDEGLRELRVNDGKRQRAIALDCRVKHARPLSQERDVARFWAMWGAVRALSYKPR